MHLFVVTVTYKVRALEEERKGMPSACWRMPTTGAITSPGYGEQGGLDRQCFCAAGYIRQEIIALACFGG